MQFGILGPLEVTDKESRPVALRGQRQRALLTILLLHANEVVSRDRLIEDLWAGDPPETAATALHGYVSQLRKALEPEPEQGERRFLQTRAPGYVLRVDPERLDLTRFEALVVKGKQALAGGDARAGATALAEALALWRGPPLSEFSTAPFALAETLRLEELRVSAVEARVEADLALGRHADLVPELERLVTQHSLRERLRAQLMLALYRSGRQADALAAYQDARRMLVEELGLEPGTELQELEKAILRHDPSLEPPPTRDPPRQRARRRRALAGVVAVAALAVGVTLALGGKEPEPMRLAPNSVAFIDAESSRVTSSFPAGREPRALAIAFDSLWAANYAEKTVARIDRASGQRVTIPVGAHPTGLAAHEGLVWVATLEGLLVPVDPRFDSVGAPIDLVAVTRGSETLGDVVSGAGFLWVAAPPITVVRVDPSEPREVVPIVPDDGVGGAIEVRASDAWVAGSSEVFPIEAETGAPTQGIGVGTPVRDLTFAAGSLWVVSGGPARRRTPVGLRRVDLGTRLIETTIGVGSDPVAVSASGGSIWVASGSDGSVSRVDPATNDVLDTIALGARPTALVADGSGVWVALE